MWVYPTDMGQGQRLFRTRRLGRDVRGRTLFYTPAAEDLAKPLGKALNIEPLAIYINQFPDSEWYVRVPEETADPNPMLVHRLFPNQNDSLLQLMLILSELADRNQKAQLVTPYLPYAKMHKKVQPGEVVSAKMVGAWLSRWTDEIVTLDCHFIKREGTVSMWGGNYANLSAAGMLLAYAREHSKEPVIVSPDEGAQYLAEGGKERFTLKKVRGGYEQGASGFQRYSKTEGRLDVAGKAVYLVDDMIATGGTMIKAISLAKEAGASRVVALATHGLFVGGADLRMAEAGADRVVVTNSIVTRYSELDIAPLLAAHLGAGHPSREGAV